MEEASPAGGGPAPWGKSVDLPTQPLDCDADPAWRQELRRRLLRWYARHQRDLPWRRTRDPYSIWLSEIMLQQTRVAAVGPYFERFLARFPTVADLAAADEQEVLRFWEGLGYYRRARQLHEAAQCIVERHGGQVPRQIQQLQSLPGIGRYTAGAVLSIAWDDRHPILEGNTVRLYSRLMAFRDDPRTARGQRRLWEFATTILPRKQVGAFNQALMELGSEICRPRTPLCDTCPLAALCAARAMGSQQEIPLAPRKPVYEAVCELSVVVRRGPCVLVRRCGRKERWAGLWDFPRFRKEDKEATGDEQALAQQVRRQTGISVRPGKVLTVLRHDVTRFRITLTCHEVHYRSGRLRDDAEWNWVEPERLKDYPLSVTGRKISRLLSHG